MASSWICLLAWAVVGYQDLDDGLPPVGAPSARPRVMVPGGEGGADAAGVELAGLARGDRAEVLTWERAYKLAVVRARSEPGKGPRRVPALDPKRLDEEARRVGFDDFARFLRDLSGGPGDGTRAFRDPAPAVLELLRRSRAAFDAQRNVQAHQRLFREARVLVKDPGSGRTQLGLDLLDAGIQRARIALVGDRRRYQDALDALKVELGLGPEVPVVADPSALSGFGEVFDAGEQWIDAAGHDYARLDQIARRLPTLDDVTIDGRSILTELRRGSSQVEDLLRAAARVAGAQSRAPDDDARTLRVRREVRLLQETWLDYQIQARGFVLAVRLTDRVRDEFFSPPAAGPAAERAVVSAFAEARVRLAECEDRLVAGWVAYQVQRLALLRDLGTPPADDWPGYLASLSARPGEEAAR